MSSKYLLGLSDLHFSSRDSQETMLALLLEDLRSEFDRPPIDGLILCGDVAEHATPEQYDLAARFMDRLVEEMSIPLGVIASCPGNHDVDWTAAKDSVKEPPAKNATGEDIQGIHICRNAQGVVSFDPDLYKKRFANYAAFHQRVTGNAYSLDYDQQFTLTRIPDLDVAILGLNSAYPLDHLRPNDPEVYVGAVNKALSQVSRDSDYADSQRIAFWHHPLQSNELSRLKSDAFARRLAKLGFCLGIHGHIHDCEADKLKYQVRFVDREMEVLSIGTFGAKHNELRQATPWQYTLFEIRRDEIVGHVRARKEFDAPWFPHAVFPAADGSAELQSSYIVTFPSGVGKHEWIRKLKGLDSHLRRRRMSRDGYSIAVEAHIFDDKGRILLQRRGPDCRDEIGHLEGVGGDIEGREDLVDALQYRIRNEIGAVTVAIDKVLEVRPVAFEEKHGKRDWIVVSYLCRLQKGEPVIQNPRKTTELIWFSLEEVMGHPDADLSRSTSRALAFYKLQYGITPYYSRREG